MCPAPRLPRAGCHQLVLTNREELSFFTVLAFPKASRIGLACSSCRSSSPCGGTQSLIRARWQCGLSPTHQEQRPAGRALVAATLPNSFLLGLCTQADQKLTCEEIRKLLALGKSAQEWEDTTCLPMPVSPMPTGLLPLRVSNPHDFPLHTRTAIMSTKDTSYPIQTESVALSLRTPTSSPSLTSK